MERGSVRADLGDAHGILRPAADEVKLAELPQLEGSVGLNPAAHRLVEGVAASLAGGSTRPLVERQQQQHTDEEQPRTEEGETLRNKWKTSKNTPVSNFTCLRFKFYLR